MTEKSDDGHEENNAVYSQFSEVDFLCLPKPINVNPHIKLNGREA
jgi:hypothetical protein